MSPLQPLTDRYVWFWNQVAERALKDFGPETRVFAYAYNRYRPPPVRETLHPGIIIEFVGFSYIDEPFRVESKENWLGWNRQNANGYFLRPNYLGEGHGYPLVYTTKMADDLRLCFDTGMIGTDFDSCKNHWATLGVNYWLLARLLWDPARDADAELSDYLRHAFGAAAPTMLTYSRVLEAATERYAITDHGRGLLRYHDRKMYKAFDGPVLDIAGRLLAQAREAATGDPDVLARLDFIGAGLEYVERQVAVARHMDRALETGEGLAEVVQAVAAREAFYAKHNGGWAINVAGLRERESNPKYRAYYGYEFVEQLEGRAVALMLPLRWRFRTDPEEAGLANNWHAADLADDGWKTIAVTSHWEKQGYPDYDGYAWYRVRFSVPAELEGRALSLVFGAVDEQALIHLNGKLIHTRRNEEPDAWTTAFDVPVSRALHYGEENVLALRVEDRTGAGGVWRLVFLAEANNDMVPAADH